MKYLAILLFVVVFIVAASAQRPRCRKPDNPVCKGSKNEGRGGDNCNPVQAWWYDTRDGKCKKMQYKGCGGNKNRYCSKKECERKCRRRGGSEETE